MHDTAPIPKQYPKLFFEYRIWVIPFQSCFCLPLFVYCPGYHIWTFPLFLLPQFLSSYEDISLIWDAQTLTAIHYLNLHNVHGICHRTPPILYGNILT